MKWHRSRHHFLRKKIYSFLQQFYYCTYRIMTDNQACSMTKCQNTKAETQFLQFGRTILSHYFHNRAYILLFFFHTSVAINIIDQYKKHWLLGASTRVQNVPKRYLLCLLSSLGSQHFHVQIMSLRLLNHRLLKHGRSIFYNCCIKRTIHLNILERKNNRLLSSCPATAKKVCNHWNSNIF